MSNADARAVVSTAVSLSASHPHAPAADVLALALQGRSGQVLDFEEPTAEHGSLASPRSPFGQLVAAAFDRAMTPADWLLFTGPDAHPQLRVACLMAWHGDVLPKMALAHCVAITGLPGP